MEFTKRGTCGHARVGALGFRVPHDVEGYAVDPEFGGGRDGSRCTFRRHGSPDAGARTSPSGRGGGSAGGPCNEQGCASGEPMCSNIRLQHELSWMQINDDRARRLARTLKNVAGGWKNAWLKTKSQDSVRKQQRSVLTAVWRVESNQQRYQREVVTSSHTRRVEQ